MGARRRSAIGGGKENRPEVLEEGEWREEFK